MAILVNRHQHNVGQGFFHSTCIHFDHDHTFSYVYDCGAMDIYSSDRRREISEYILNNRNRRRIDILFISHCHADHVNGLPQLLHRNNGMKVDTIVMPFINVEERILAFARALLEDKKSATQNFYREFVTSPSDCLERFSPRQIIFVRSGKGEGKAPDGEEEPMRPEWPSGFGSDIESSDATWRLVGEGAIDDIDEAEPDRTPVSKRILMDHTAAISVDIGHVNWLMAPYIDQSVKSQVNIFIRSLASCLGIRVNCLKNIINNRKSLKNLIDNHMSEIFTAYKFVDKNINTTSMCLYSGLARYGNKNVTSKYFAGFGHLRFSNNFEIKKRIGWLGTGDASLKHTKRHSNFVNHYGSLLDEICTFTLPHHGLDHNLDPKFLKSIKADFFIASAEKFSNWKHPGPHTIQSIHSLPAFMQVVTSNKNTRANEKILIL